MGVSPGRGRREKKLTEAINEEFVSSKTRRMGYAVLEHLRLVSQALLATGDPQLPDRAPHFERSGGNSASIASRMSRGPQLGRATGESFRERIMEPVVPTVPGFDVYAATSKAGAPADFIEVVSS